MRRSDMLITIAKALVDAWHKEHAPKLKGSTYYGYSIAEAYKTAKVMLDVAEDKGMFAPARLVEGEISCEWDEEEILKDVVMIDTGEE